MDTGTNASPLFTSASSISVSENTIATGYTATASDAEGDTVTFSISGGADQAILSVDGNSGVLSFNTAADFEAPTDSDLNNSYEVEITASDGTNSVAQSVTISVTNVNDVPPSFTSASSISVPESTIVTGYTAMAIDAEGDMVVFSLSGGTDQALLSIDNSSGVLSFDTAADFEVPADSDANNSYVVEITASDGINAIVKTVTINVTNIVNEVPAVAATPLLGFEIKTFRFTWVDVADATYYQLLENPDGVSGFAQIGSNIAQGTQIFDHIVPLYARLNSQYILQSCNVNGCADSAPLVVNDNLVAAIGYLKASNTNPGDQFGWSLDLSSDGNTLAVGAYQEDSNVSGIDGNQMDNSASGSGAVYIFSRSGGVWSQQAYLKASNTDASDEFGWALSLSADGSTLAVGAWRETSDANGVDGDQMDNSTITSGAVYIFTRSISIWNQQAYLKASNSDFIDGFGWFLSLSADGNTLAVGAVGEASNATGIDGDQSNNTAGSSGAVYIFIRSSDIWSQQVYLKASNTETVDFFGTALSLSADGKTLAVGAMGEASNASGIDGDQTDNTTPRSGAVYVFTRSVSIWSQQAYLKASNTDAGDLFGIALSLSADGNTLAVGAYREASNASGIDSNQQMDNTVTDSGAVYLFSRSGSTWSQQVYLKASNPEENDWFGRVLSLSADGATLVVGVWQEDSNANGIGGDQMGNTGRDSGAAYLFTRNSGTWSQQAYLKASNTDVGDRFGVALSLSADGNTLAVGADLEDSNATGVGGNQVDNGAGSSGSVYLY